MQAGTYPARTDRLVVAGLLAYPGFAVDEPFPARIRQGVKPSYQNQQLKVRPAATPNMTVIVSGGYCFIDQHDTGGTGTYLCFNDGDVTLTVAPAGGAGQYRKDSVVASVYDAEYAGAVSEWRLEIIQGPYAASAGATVRGTLPPNAQLLADISIGPSQTSVTSANISDLRQFTVAAGGIVPVPSSTMPTRTHPGQVVYTTDTDRFLYGKNDGSQGELQKALPAAWSSWTPSWSTTSGSATPSYGNATVTGHSVKLVRTVLANFEIVFGSSTNFGSSPGGSDNWQFTLPHTAARTDAAVGWAEISANSNNARGQCRVRLASTGAFVLEVSSGRVDNTAYSGATGVVDSISPWTWASGYSIRGTLQYEAAS
jgi:hypothetical protein